MFIKSKEILHQTNLSFFQIWVCNYSNNKHFEIIPKPVYNNTYIKLTFVTFADFDIWKL